MNFQSHYHINYLIIYPEIICQLENYYIEITSQNKPGIYAVERFRN